MTPVLAKPGRVTGCSEDSQLVADLFHALNQPITALRCSLELSLHRPRTAEQYRETLQAAMQQAELIAGWAVGIRALLQADDAGDELQVLALDSFLRDAVADLQPVAESLQLEFGLHCDSAGCVLFEPQRLQQALSGVLDFAIGLSSAGATVMVDAHERDREAVIVLATSPGAAALGSGSAWQPPKDAGRILRQRLGLAIPRRIVAAAGGSLQAETSRAGLRIELCLPLVPALV
jgi:C4-dicarboxylate-specific signal transduction histidine kinase